MKIFVFIALILAIVSATLSQKKLRITGSYPGSFAPLRDFVSDYVVATPKDGEFTILSHKVLREPLIGQIITGHSLLMSGVANAYHTYVARDRCPGRATTSETAAAHNCKLATNAGFFDMLDGSCIGPVVSDGQILHSTSRQGVVFGITSDNKYVAGYVNSSVIDKGNFKQLVQGRGWLVHNGQSFINTSSQIEDIERSFITLIAPRLAVGWDREGRLILLIVDGVESKLMGVDLYTFTDMLIKLGCVEAVNLDGGGSVTFVWDGHICESNGVGQEKCEGNPEGEPFYQPYERPVTSITCFKTD